MRSAEDIIKAGTDVALGKALWNSGTNPNKVAGFPSKFKIDWDALCPSRVRREVDRDPKEHQRLLQSLGD